MLCYTLAPNYFFCSKLIICFNAIDYCYSLNGLLLFFYFFSQGLEKVPTIQILMVGKPRRADPPGRGEVCKPDRRDRKREFSNSPTQKLRNVGIQTNLRTEPAIL